MRVNATMLPGDPCFLSRKFYCGFENQSKELLLDPSHLEDLSNVAKAEFPVNIHVLGVVPSESDIMTPELFNKGGNVSN